MAQRALSGLAGFVTALKVKYQDIEVGLDFDPEPGLADNGDLATDLQDLMEAAGAAAKAGDICLALFIDELQYVKGAPSLDYCPALHIPKTAPRNDGRGRDPAGSNPYRKSQVIPERLFEFPEIGPLSPKDAKLAIAKPAKDEDVEIEDSALDAIVAKTECYPYFLQEWGKHAWDMAEQSPITVAAVEAATEQAVAVLDESFFRVRFDRLTPAERSYLRGMAQQGPDPHRSGDIAVLLGRSVNSLAAYPQPTHQQGNDMEPQLRTHCIHRSDV